MNTQLTSGAKLYSYTQTENFSSLVLYGTFMFTNLDYIGILDYLIKAILGGVVWFGLKLIADYFTVRVKHHAEQRNKKEVSANANNDKHKQRK